MKRNILFLFSFIGCSAAPIWVHKLKSLCELSTTVYSSLCGIVYCSICPHFRHKAQFILSKFIPFLKPTIPRLMSSASLDPNMVEREQLSLHLIRNPSIILPPSTNIVPNIVVNDVWDLKNSWNRFHEKFRDLKR